MFVPSGVTELGVTEQVAAVGAPLQLSEVVWLNPDTGAMVRVYSAAWPAVTVLELGEAEIEKPVPMPESATVWGVPRALTVIVKAPVRVPVAVGVKVTPMLQLFPTARGVPTAQVVVSASRAKSPLTAKSVKFNVPSPVFVTERGWAELKWSTGCVLKSRLEGDTEMSSKG